MRYIPLTDAERKEMLSAIGVSSTQELFSAVPNEVRWKSAPDLPPAMTEAELRSYFSKLAKKNEALPSRGWDSYLGGGAYEHFTPAVVDALSSRGEFATAYTPYQPEVSQGTLQMIFEFQSLVANLFGCDAGNASMYDGASALAEAVLMAARVKDGKKIYISKAVHPEYRQVIRTYCSDTDLEFIELDVDGEGRTVIGALDPGAVAVVVQQPNFFGVVEVLEPLAQSAHAADGLFVVNTTEPLSFALLKPPGQQGADIVCGEGQSFGNSMSFGGPWVGLFATKKSFIRQMPGRLVGRTVDQNGEPGYVLTLATREQHIRREKATSNICTNHSLCALRACIYMATLGERGLREVAIRNAWGARALRSSLLGLRGVEPVYSGPFFNEFVVRLQKPVDTFLTGMEKEKILAGIPLSRWEKGKEKELLITVTETKKEDDFRRYIDAARKVLS